MLLSAQKLLLKIIENSLAELVIARILSKLREFKIVVDILRFVYHEVSNVQTFLPLLQIFSRLKFKSLTP
jgi:hypothetical protein